MKNKLILGTVQLGLDYGINNQDGKPSLEKAFKILHTAFDHGIRILDTAEAYGNAQEVIGEFQKLNPDKPFKIISKLAADNSLKRNELLSHISENLAILRTSQLYGYMFHNYESFKKNEHFYHEIKLAKEAGLIQKAGISLYSNEEVEDICSNYSEFDFIQIPFNLLDNETKRKEFIVKTKKKGIEVHTRSVFLQGLFFKNSNKLSKKLQELAPYLKSIDEVKHENKIDTQTLALQYVLQKSYIDQVLIGVENEKQLLDNIKISKQKNSFSTDIIDAINVEQEDLLNPSNWN